MASRIGKTRSAWRVQVDASSDEEDCDNGYVQLLMLLMKLLVRSLMMSTFFF